MQSFTFNYLNFLTFKMHAKIELTCTFANILDLTPEEEHPCQHYKKPDIDVNCMSCNDLFQSLRASPNMNGFKKAHLQIRRKNNNIEQI